jgi:hypothetical protein
MVILSVYDQIADLLASLEPAKILALKSSEEAQTRFTELIEKHHNDRLNDTEKDELDHFVVLVRLIRLAKLRSLTPIL